MVGDSAETERRACDSTLTSAIADSTLTTVRLAIRRVDGVLPGPYSGLILQELATRFRPPQPLRLPVFSAGPIQMRTMRVFQAGTPSLRSPALNGLYNLTLHRDGSASRFIIVVPTLASGLDSAVIDIVQKISAERFFPFPLDEVADDSIVLQLRLTNAHAGTDAALDLFTSYFPEVPVVDAERMGPEPTPQFPAEERKAGMFGDVRFQVVVDAFGRPDLETLEILHAPTRDFAISAVKALAVMRWTPARVGRCSVPQLVHVNVRFDNPGADSASARRAP